MASGTEIAQQRIGGDVMSNHAKISDGPGIEIRVLVRIEYFVGQVYNPALSMVQKYAAGL